MKVFLESITDFFDGYTAAPHWADEAVGENITPPYVVWMVMDHRGDRVTETYDVPRGAVSTYLRVNCWGGTKAESIDLHDAIVQRFDTVPIQPSGYQAMHRPRLESAVPVPDRSTRLHQVVSRWYLRWDRS